MEDIFAELQRFQPNVGGPVSPAAFLRCGEYWRLTFDGTATLLRDAKGLHYLACLLAHPGEKISAASLATCGESNALEPLAMERARSAVTKRIRDALQRIEKNHPALGRHLHGRVKTGYDCRYSPDPDQPLIWEL